MVQWRGCLGLGSGGGAQQTGGRFLKVHCIKVPVAGVSKVSEQLSALAEPISRDKLVVAENVNQLPCSCME